MGRDEGFAEAMCGALVELPRELIYAFTLPGRTTSCASGAQAANVMTDALALSTSFVVVVVVVVVHVVVVIVSSLLLQVVTVVVVVTWQGGRGGMGLNTHIAWGCIGVDRVRELSSNKTVNVGSDASGFVLVEAGLDGSGGNIGDSITNRSSS